MKLYVATLLNKKGIALLVSGHPNADDNFNISTGQNMHIPQRVKN